MFHILMAVLANEFDAQENRSQDHRGQQESYHRIALTQLCALNSQCHGEAASEQYHRIYRPKLYVQKVAAGDECDIVLGAIDGIAHEHTAKKHNLSGQEHPHPQTRGLMLLFAIVELFRHGDVRVRQFETPASASRTRRALLCPPTCSR